MRLDSFLDPGDTGTSIHDGYIRRHRAAPPEPIIAKDRYSEAERQARHRGTLAALIPHVDLEWQATGNCKGHPPTWWIPDLHRGRTENDAVDERAKALCRTCPIRPRCLDHALEHGEHGYWGGTTTRTRARMRQARAS